MCGKSAVHANEEPKDKEKRIFICVSDIIYTSKRHTPPPCCVRNHKLRSEKCMNVSFRVITA